MSGSMRKMDFQQPSRNVAFELLGRTLHIDLGDEVRSLRITEVGAYVGETPSSYQVVRWSPGTVGVSTKFGNKLLDVSTCEEGGLEKRLPSCVTFRGGVCDETGERYDGPGKLCEFFGIDAGTQHLLDRGGFNNQRIWMSGSPVDQSIVYDRNDRKAQKSKSANCDSYLTYDDD